jgi:hypothetical protein
VAPASSPDRAPTERAFRRDGLTGLAWGEVPEELARAFPEWLARGAPEGEVRLSAAVFRAGGFAVKRFPAPSVFGWVREPRALRSARRHFACLPVASPRPLVALAESRRSPSLLVREFLEGRVLAELWGRDEASERALPGFLADLRRLAMQHGDLHPGNLLWTGERWVLLDVDGLRHGLHLRRRVLLGQWTCLAAKLTDEARVERLFRRTLELAPGLDDTRWTDVQHALALRRAAP